MPNITIADLDKGGLVQDLAPHELTPEAFNRADNVRFHMDCAQVFEGYRYVYDQNPVIENPKWMMAWASTQGFKWIYGGDTKLATLTGIAHTDVTRATGDYTATNSYWNGTLLGDFPIVNNESTYDPPQAWDANTARFIDLPNWQAATYCKFLNVYNRFVIAYKITKAGVYNPRMVKWSEPADPGTYPNSWDEADPSKLTGEVTLSDTSGEIMCAVLMNTYNIIYKNDTTVLMRYVGGSQIFSFETLFSDFGALTANSVVHWQSQHFVVTEADVVVHNGHSYESVITEKNRDFLFDNLHPLYIDKLCVRLYERRYEIWICYADINSEGQLNKVLSWNYKKNTWSAHDLPEINYVAYGYLDTTTISRIYDDQSRTYAEVTENTYDDQPASPILNDLMGVRQADGTFYQFNDVFSLGGAPIPVRLERSGLAVAGADLRGQLVLEMDSTKFIRRVHPRINSSEPVSIYLGSQYFPDGPIKWNGPFTFDPNTMRFFDCRINTKFICYRVESFHTANWKFYSITFDIDVIGEAPR